ncbi:GDP-mannose 4,6-dehydratase [Streptomyces shenzhenensis]|uniref:GDP-mannose 4,6-dehydratase n=1 Tax=Streptomyces shenzhenensis TaxID=943815 RepID=UPI001F1F3EB8|nr:GDP-mannose 4,6-dehydratase [Streptomyces shenzhenensis]
MQAETALITGIAPQDDSCTAEVSLEKGYTVRGIFRRTDAFTTGRIDHLYQHARDPEAELSLAAAAPAPAQDLGPHGR